MRDETKTESLDMAYIEHFGLEGLPFTVYTCPTCGRRFAGDDILVGRDRLCFACGLAASRRDWDAKMAKADAFGRCGYCGEEVERVFEHMRTCPMRGRWRPSLEPLPEHVKNALEGGR